MVFPVTTHIQFGDGLSVTDLGNEAIRVDAASAATAASTLALGTFQALNVPNFIVTSPNRTTRPNNWTLLSNIGGNFGVATGASAGSYIYANDPLGTLYEIGVTWNFDNFIADTQPNYSVIQGVDDGGNYIAFQGQLAEGSTDQSTIDGTKWTAHSCRFLVRSSAGASYLRFTPQLYTWADPVTTDAYCQIVRLGKI